MRKDSLGYVGCRDEILVTSESRLLITQVRIVPKHHLSANPCLVRKKSISYLHVNWDKLKKNLKNWSKVMLHYAAFRDIIVHITEV